MTTPEGPSIENIGYPSKKPRLKPWLCGERHRPTQQECAPSGPLLRLLPDLDGFLRIVNVVDGRQFLELGQRAQGRGIGLTRAATAGRQEQSGRRYSGEGDQLNELLHRKCGNAGAGRESQGRLPVSQGKNQARGHKSVAPGFDLKWDYFPGTTTFGGATGAGALWFEAQEASASPTKAAKTATILVSFI